MIDTAFAIYNNIIDLNSQFDHWKKIKYEKGRGEVKPNEWLNKTMPTYNFQSKLYLAADFLKRSSYKGRISATSFKNIFVPTKENC